MLNDNIPVTINDIADETNCSVSDVKKAMQIFIDQDMVDCKNETFHLTNWDSRQYVTDNVTERVKKHRAKHKGNVSRNVSVTPPEAEADTDTDTEEEGEEDNVVLPAPSSAEMTEVFKVFQNEIGIVSQIVAEKVADDVNAYSAPWVMHAIKIAALRGRRSLPYAESILSDWKSKGFDQTRKPWDEEKKGAGGQHHGANRENTYQGSVGGKSQNSGPAVPSRVRKAGDS